MTVQKRPLSSERRGQPSPKGLFITDFDGTLLRSDRTFARRDIEALKGLAGRQIVRIVATGRSMHSFLTVGVKRLPVDYVIFSTGAGVAEWPSGRLIRKTCLQTHQVTNICEALNEAGLAQMVLRPIPQTHFFAYTSCGPPCADFHRRLKLYAPYAEKLEDNGRGFGEATQILVIVDAHKGAQTLELIRKVLPDLSIIQTTSPLDGESTWIEIFPRGVSKSATANWLAQKLSVSPDNVLSVGNDYNDLDLLEWAGTSCVVANAPAELRERYSAVASNNENGIAEAIGKWLSMGHGPWDMK